MPDHALSLEQLLMVPHTALRGIEAEIVDLVVANLDSKVSGTWTESDDALFRPFTAYVKPAWGLQWAHRAIRVWLAELLPRVEAAERRLGSRIHKGAPIYNTGLCFFMAGDLARAAQYIAAAAEEDRETHGAPSRLLEGEGMGEQVLLGPLYRWLEATFGSSYQEATGRTLVAEEVRQLVRFLGARQSDAVLFLMAINRYAAQVKGHDNTASRLHRVRAFADLLLIFESSLRKWQSLPASPRANLCRRVQELLRPSLVASAELNRRLQQYPGADWEDTLVLDEVVRQELARFSEVSVRAEKAAIAVFTSYRLRNSVMHVVDDQLQLFSAPEILEQVMGLALIAIRASSYGADDAIDEL